MRKILLSTSAMIGLVFATGTMNTSSADADQKPKLKISGKTSVSMYMFKSQKDNKDQKKKKGYNVATRVESSKISFNAKGSTEALGGLDYSLLIGLSGDRNQTNSARETRIQIKSSSYGTLAFGNTKGPEDKFKKLGASKIIGAMGGFTGSIKDIIKVSSGILWSTDLIGSPKSSNKIVYFTPRVEGFQFGIAYTPNTQQHGSSPSKALNKKFDKSNWVGQLSYRNSFNNGASLGLSLTGVAGQTQDLSGTSFVVNELYNTASWAVGGQIGYAGWEVGAEYIDNGKSNVNTTHIDTTATAGKVINFGISYSWGSYKIAAAYYHSDKNLGKLTKEGAALDTILVEGTELGKAKADLYSITYDFKVAPGLAIFAEANYFELKNKQQQAVSSFQDAYSKLNTKASKSCSTNKGHVILVGTKINF